MSGTSTTTPYLIPNDWILSIPIDALTAAGTEVNLPSGDIPTVVSSAPASFAADIVTTADSASLVVHALVDGSVAPGTVYTVTLTDSAGLNSVEQFFTIVADMTPVTLLEDIPNATHTIQPVPPPG
jgi:hypothetical protein